MSNAKKGKARTFDQKCNVLAEENPLLSTALLFLLPIAYKGIYAKIGAGIAGAMGLSSFEVSVEVSADLIGLWAIQTLLLWMISRAFTETTGHRIAWYITPLIAVILAGFTGITVDEDGDPGIASILITLIIVTALVIFRYKNLDSNKGRKGAASDEGEGNYLFFMAVLPLVYYPTTIAFARARDTLALVGPHVVDANTIEANQAAPWQGIVILFWIGVVVDIIAAALVIFACIHFLRSVKHLEQPTESGLKREYASLDDGSRIFYSGPNENGKVVVEIERPCDEGCKTAKCILPDFDWVEDSGFSTKEREQITNFLKANLYLIMRYADDEGGDIA